MYDYMYYDISLYSILPKPKYMHMHYSFYKFNSKYTGILIDRFWPGYCEKPFQCSRVEGDFPLASTFWILPESIHSPNNYWYINILMFII